jgi:CPA2 family monovalent cation:H+ antiporter-2
VGDLWTLILDTVIVLGGATLFGLIFEKLKLGSVLGYLSAGVIVGPSLLNLIESQDMIHLIAEMGVALLLFTIGLEFSWKRLVSFGKKAVLSGAIALLSIMVVMAGIGVAFNLDWRAALAIGASASIGSTAMVLRILRNRKEMDATHGRFSLAILLTQDVALIPLVLIVSFLAGDGSSLATTIGSAVLNTALLVVGMTLVVSLVIPRLLDEKVIARNREIPILLAITTAIGATWAAHALGVSPALGAFIAGLLLAEGRFADQMRADALPLRTLFMAVFFVSIGLLADISWIGMNVGLVLGATVLLIVAKTVITYFSVHPFHRSIVDSLATAIAISQVGEFSFVLLDSARNGGLIDNDLFKLATSVTLLTLFLTPFMTGNAQRLALGLAKILVPTRKLIMSERQAHKNVDPHNHVIVIGFGPTGRTAAREINDADQEVLVVDSGPQIIREATKCGFDTIFGDATQLAILEKAGIKTASAVVVAVPDHISVRIIASQCKHAAPDIPVVVRSRFHLFAEELNVVGADMVLDEEQTMGILLGRSTLTLIRSQSQLNLPDSTSESA